jgi:hypothetical protein
MFVLCGDLGCDLGCDEGSLRVENTSFRDPEILSFRDIGKWMILSIHRMKIQVFNSIFASPNSIHHQII